jgi:endonuclease/exonuclease/phosphatase family metal-dependent hydrolase
MEISFADRGIRGIGVAAFLGTLSGCDLIEGKVADPVGPPPARSIWTSRADCEERLTDREPNERAPRIGTWNILYFPDAQEEPQGDEEKATDVAWLACAMASLDVDILVVQEVKQSAAARDKQRELIDRLNEWTDGDWRIELSTCEPHDVQHPGFLYDANRVTGSQFRDVPVLSPNGECSNDVSPGFAGYFSIETGPDFHLIAVHMEAYKTAYALASRRDSVAAMAQVATDARAIVADDDVIFAGDFNTTGCDECDPAVSSSDEVLALNREVRLLDVPCSLLPASLACSHPGGSLLDHFVVAESMQELPPGAIAEVAGICSETECSHPHEHYQLAIERVSDHCPITLELAGADQD